MQNETNEQFDGIIVGGGLAGGLLFYALTKNFPHRKFLLLERADHLGGNHTWCFHDTDVAQKSNWIRELVSKTWDSYEVRFPTYSRRLDSKYNAIRSEDFHTKIVAQAKLSNSKIIFDCSIASLSKSSVAAELKNEKINCTAPWVVDSRGWNPRDLQNVAYQKFIGLDLEFEQPHGLKHVILKDATVEQTDGYRFFYALPWSDTTMLLEDTYYSSTDHLDELEIPKGIIQKAEAQYGKVKRVRRQEIGRLPLPLHPTHQTSNEISRPIALGARSGFFNPVTGYSLPQTLQSIEVLLGNLQAEIPADQLPEAQRQFLALQKDSQSFFYVLNRMFFMAAEPKNRYKVISRFYKLPASTIHRFYSGQLNFLDKFRILVGKPPVPIGAALRAVQFKSRSVEGEL